MKCKTCEAFYKVANPDSFGGLPKSTCLILNNKGEYEVCPSCKGSGEMNEEKEIPMVGGKASTSQIPDFHLIPTESMIRLAERFKLGIERKGDKSWNAISKNQEILTDKDFIINRIGHIIHHCLKLRDKITNNEDLSTDDDAGAISWGGAFLCCATKELNELNTLNNLKKLIEENKSHNWIGKSEGVQGSVGPQCHFDKIYSKEVEIKTTPESDKPYGEQTYEKEIQMENGKYYLINTVTHKIFGTNNFETKEEAEKEIDILNEKWKNKPLDKRDLKVVRMYLMEPYRIKNE